jgi:hypothetical protein
MFFHGPFSTTLQSHDVPQVCPSILSLMVLFTSGIRPLSTKLRNVVVASFKVRISLIIAVNRSALQMLRHGDVWSETGLSDTDALLSLNLVGAVTMESSNQDTPFKKISRSVPIFVVLSHIHVEYGKRNAEFKKCDAPTGNDRS